MKITDRTKVAWFPLSASGMGGGRDECIYLCVFVAWQRANYCEMRNIYLPKRVHYTIHHRNHPPTPFIFLSLRCKIATSAEALPTYLR